MILSRTFHPGSLPWVGDVAALLAGALMVLGFAPYSLGWIAPFSLAVLYWLWLDATPGRAAWRGWLFGAGLFGGGVYWVYFSMHIYGQMPAALAVVFTVVMALLLALSTALTGWLARRWSAGSVLTLLLIFPGAWVSAEWVRSWLFTGFPWLYVGYTQLQLPLGNLAPLLGVYGVGWALAISAGLLVVTVRSHPGAIRIGAAAALLALWIGAWSVGNLQWTQPSGEPLRVSLLQPNVAQLRKWDPSYRRDILTEYVRLTRDHWDSDLIVWPETAVPVFYDEVANGYLDVLAAQARSHNTELLIGLPVRLSGGIYYNSMLTLGSAHAFYHKRHLVPFGEYIPLRGLLGTVLDILQVPMSNFSSGDEQQPPLPVGDYRAGISICYEIAFPAEVRSFLPQAQWLINVSNNTWFGDSSAPHQVLQMAQMRARETGRYVLSATNDGITAIVNEQGRVLARAPQFQETVLSGALQPRQGSTPYVRMGDWPVLVVMMLGWLGAVWYGRRRAGRVSGS